MNTWTSLRWSHPGAGSTLTAAVSGADAPSCDLRWDTKTLDKLERMATADTPRGTAGWLARVINVLYDASLEARESMTARYAASRGACEANT